MHTECTAATHGRVRLPGMRILTVPLMLTLGVAALTELSLDVDVRHAVMAQTQSAGVVPPTGSRASGTKPEPSADNHR